MSRIIFHSDLNCFYASVEMMLDPSLRGKAVAVCGATEDRHGIVLAKSEKAKKAGVKTGMVNWEAQRLCKDLILVPPQYDQYLKYSALTRSIYQRYTDLVEPYGMDECWLDVTGNSCGLQPMELADEIRRTVKDELGLTVSIGVYYNKVFAKLGSDMKKPDAITEITEMDFKEKVWPLPASDLLYVGRATTAKLARYGVHTIGDIVQIGQAFMHVKPRIELNKFGREGLTYEGIGENKKWSRIETYGPKLTENVVQGTARDLLAYAMLRLDGAGYPVVMHIHDEAVAEVPEGTGSVADMTTLMSQGPEWAAGLPLRADGYECYFYKKD